MKTKFTLLLMSCALLAGIWFSGSGQTGTPAAVADAQAELDKCIEELNDHDIRVNNLGVLLSAYTRFYAQGDEKLSKADQALYDRWQEERWKLTLEDRWGNSERKWICLKLKRFEGNLQKEIEKSKQTPTPTPTPSPVTTDSTKSAPKQSPTPIAMPTRPGPTVILGPTPTPTPSATPTPSPSPSAKDSPASAPKQSPTPLAIPTPQGPIVFQRSTPSPNPSPTGTPSREEQEEVRKELEKIIDGMNPLTAEINDWVKKRKKKLPPVKAPDGLETDTLWQPGLQTVRFDLPHGSIVVNLPDDMQAGDTISGTVTVAPKGKDEQERNQNSIAVQNFAIELNMPDTTIVRVPLATVRNNFAFVLGSDPGNGTVGCTLVTRNGADVASLKVPISPAPLVTPNATTPRPANFQLPSLGQTGRLLEIKGAFDGSSANTKVTVGGKPLQTLAESPRKCVFESPRDVTGPTEVQVNEGGREGRGDYRNLDLRLSSPKLNLSRGEKTTLTVEVTGLAGIRSDVPLQLEKTGTVTMERGDVQHLQIRPPDVNANGSFVLTRGLTGVLPGGFNVTATVFDPTRRPVIIPLREGARVNGYRLIQNGGTPSFGADGVIDPLTGKPLNGEHKLQAGCGQPSLAKLPLLALRFKNGNAGQEKTNCFIFVTPYIIRD